ncbi:MULTISPECIES: leucine-rich repeat protein [Hungatella]|uniref:Leucine-rich repeat protein n=1 Tax=Hungatella hathewayi TaxID=154046 RepID=A0AAW9WHQ3_9FIRM|nr:MULTISPECIES: leucine-rich repeat protein [Hungatella]MCQ4831767.1 leucine-rich repeat protein [Hungatella sp. SL.1.14]MUB63507.1 leucine-rich repeat protein [Hungatella hathewayi]CUQ42457.1 Ig domain-containing protein [Hungatella hathewayi]
MKRKYTRVISALLAVLLISTQPAVMTWADSMVPADHLLGGDEYIGKKTGYATPSDAEQKDEDALKPDDTPKDDEIPSTEIPSTEIPSHENLTDGKQPEYENTEKMVVRWEFVDDENLSGGELSLIGVSPENRADFDTVVSMLPEQVRAEIEEADEVTLPIADWSCPEYQQDEDGEWPFTGEYEFIAELPEGYVCEPPISVLVTLGGAMVNTINDRFTIDGLRYKELGPDTVQLIGYDGEKPVETLVIPDKVRKPSNGREYQVASIGRNAFLDCSALTGDLVIPDTVTEIGDGAFEGCHFTGELTLSDSLVTIGEDAFYECGFTGQLVLPQTLTRIGAGAFMNTTFSGQLILPEKLNYIGWFAFYHCNFTGDLIIPDGVTIIDSYTFSDNSFTGTLTLPNKLKEIGRESFYKCGFTGELVLPDGLTIIGPDAFKDCSKLTGRLSIPDGITSIEHHAFYNTGFDGFDTTKQEIADLLYASGVDESKIKVGNQTYHHIQPPSVSGFQDGDMEYQVIGSDTVALTGYKGNSDTDISIPDKVTDLASGTTYSVTQIGSSAFYHKEITGSLHLPNTLVSIGENAFHENRFTGDLTIPVSVSYMGLGAFDSAGFTGDLTIEGKLTRLEDYGFFKCGFTGALSLPDTLTYIGGAVFLDCGFTGSLQLPAGITYIEESSFYNCSSFTGTLQLPAEVNYIGGYSFFNCSGFTGALQLPKPITEIGEMAFYGCDGLDSAHLGPNVQKLGTQAFSEALPLSTDSPRVQLLINTYLNQDTIADTSWDGKEDVPDGAVATIKQDTTVTGDRRIGTEAVITVPSGGILTVDGKLTVDGNLVVNGTIFAEGTLIINGSLSGSGTLIIGKNDRVEGDASGCRVEYQEDQEDIESAKKMIESQIYTTEQESAGAETAVKGRLLEAIEAIPGFGDTGVTVGELKITAFTPASEGTSDRPDGMDGSFAFTLLLSKGNSKGGAGGAGTIRARGYSYIPVGRPSGSNDGEDYGSNAVNPDILRGTWERTETGIWKFRQTGGAYAVSRWGMVDGLWYYFDGEGRMLTGWQFINNQWYYLCREEDSKTKNGLKEGAMATGWHFDPIYQAWFYLDTSGAMAVGQKVIDGKQYYFNPEPDGTRGAMQQ